MSKTTFIAAAFILTSGTAFAGSLKIPGKGDIKKPDTSATECKDDKGVEQLGKDMDDKAFDGLVAANNALANLHDAAGKKDEATKLRDTGKGWTKQNAPGGYERVKLISGISDNITKNADALAKQEKFDAAATKAVNDARWELRKAVIQVAWGTKIGEPVPVKAKEAIEGAAACTKKVKGAADAAAGLGTLLTNLKKSYTAVDAAAKKAGAKDLSEEEKKKQDSETGAPSGLGV